jgi:hypothetical protein
MRSWGNRADTAVIDEPFYAYYLKTTGKEHPAAPDVIANGETNWRKVVHRLTGPVPNGRKIFFQKQMTHHLLPEVDRNWLGEVTNFFLIRAPAEVITSYIKKNQDPALEDLGFVPRSAGPSRCAHAPTRKSRSVVAKDVLQKPERILRLLCEAVGVEFECAMLSWPRGVRETDGIWGKYWYDEVAKSTSFQPYRPKNEPVPDRLREIHNQCREFYERLYQYRLH